MLTVNAGARLDRLPASRFHYRILGLIGGGMFLDAFEIYLQAAVLAALIGTGWSTPGQNANFVSATFAGMVIGAWLAGITGDRYGRRFSYQVNLLIFGLASLAGAAAPSMNWLIAARFVMGIGLGAEIVVGYVAISELMPPASRGRWGAGLATVTNSSLFISALVGRLIIPSYGWRWMFVIVGIGALVVWYLRKRMPESPRWLEANGQPAEAERIMGEIEAEVERSTGRKLPEAPNVLDQSSVNAVGRLSDLFSREMLARTITGSVILIALNTAIYGFIAFLPSFMVRQGFTIITSLNYITLMSFGAPVGALIGMALADKIGRKPCIVVFSFVAIVAGAIYPQLSDPTFVMLTGFILVAAVYVLVAVAWSMYVPELFPTVIRMRGAGFCNTLGRFMTILTPQITTLLYGLAGLIGVLAYVVGLLLLQVIVVIALGIETKRMPLEVLSEAMIARAKSGSTEPAIGKEAGAASQL
ncbi:MFS transporter [Bradyrhizobium canariense]|uniref:MFS transporter, putative metabolite:H+ symporter n=1 Tax=Bradyrhizobium canariense TaxID=255045 RepID=A0A1H2BRD9_9BRAD|nr:MFS transporter [Bradyrhizobium canariense]SDT60811.1 MFS transporter, putative metabolite:H+ symporter [Bradyrhizobium canariense]